jgi:membrane protease YdiL (CAAX protease family)
MNSEINKNKRVFNWSTPLIIEISIFAITLVIGIPITFLVEDSMNYIIPLSSFLTQITLALVFFITIKFYPIDLQILSLKINLKKALLYSFMAILSVGFTYVYHLCLDGKPVIPFECSDKTIFTVLRLISMILLAPIIEEFLYRAVIFNNLSKKYSFIFSALYSSLLFSLIHLPPVNFVPLLLFSFMACWIFRRENKIVYPIIFHAICSIATLIVSIYA